MNTNFSEFEKVEEGMHIASKIKLRDSIHNVVMEHLEPGKEMTLIELSGMLKDKFGVNISSEVLEQLLFVMWWRKDDYTIFREKDKKWLDVWPYRKTIERKKRIKEPPLGKSRRKIKKEEDDKKRQSNAIAYYNNFKGRRTSYNTTHNPNRHSLNKNSDIDDEEDRYGYGYW